MVLRSLMPDQPGALSGTAVGALAAYAAVCVAVVATVMASRGCDGLTRPLPDASYI